MLPIRTILHPTDFSEHAQHALNLASALARDHNSELVLLHVLPTPVVVYGEGFVPAEPEDFRQQVEDKLERLTVPGYRGRIRRIVKEGDPAREIVDLSRELSANLIVMGTHGRTGLERLLMGSVAELVARRAACPVLTVKTPFPAAEEEIGTPAEALHI